MKHSELLRKQYDFELDQRNGLTSATNIPMVAITVVASATSVILIDYRYGPDAATFAFCLFTSATLAAIAFSVYSVFRSFWNYDYKKLPQSKDILQHYDALHDWHLKNGSASAEARDLADEDFSDFLVGNIAEATDWNGQNNIVRGNRLHRATAAIALAVGLLLPAALIYAHNKITAEEKIHSVRIVHPTPSTIKEPQMSSGKGSSSSSQPASSPAPAPAPAPVPAAKPAGPPNLVFKGNSDLTKPSTGHVPGKK